MKNLHVWVYDGKGGGHRGEFDFDCTVCGATDWVSGADLTKGKTPSALGCSGAKGEMGSVLRELDDYARGVADERAQVEAARAWADRNTEITDVVEPATDPWTAGYDDAITDLLAAMDGEKP